MLLLFVRMQYPVELVVWCDEIAAEWKKKKQKRTSEAIVFTEIFNVFHYVRRAWVCPLSLLPNMSDGNVYLLLFFYLSSFYSLLLSAMVLFTPLAVYLSRLFATTHIRARQILALHKIPTMRVHGCVWETESVRSVESTTIDFYLEIAENSSRPHSHNIRKFKQINWTNTLSIRLIRCWH